MPYTLDLGTVYYYGESELEDLTDLRSQEGKTQIYEDVLKKTTDDGNHFKDPDFPHNDDSVGDISKLLDVANPGIAKVVEEWRNYGWDGSATWLRIAELCQKKYGGKNTACFNCGDVGKTIARNDVQQGLTGDCWFLSSVASVSMVPQLIKVVVPERQNTNNEGVYHFRFWYEGAWVDISVDDYIPTFKVGDQYNTVGTNFFPNNGKAEFWPMLLEKAFAKLNGSYSNIASNCIMYALENLTGGFGVFKDKIPKNLFYTILKWFDKISVIAAGTNTSKDGIIGDHAYSMTGARILHLNDGSTVNLVRMRNPWGHGDWEGDWSDKSSRWDEVSQEQKNAIGLVDKDTGEFWMSYDDFSKYYCGVSASHFYSPKIVNKPASKLQFVQFYTEWSTSNHTAGGFNSPWDNPLYEVELSSDDESGKCILEIGLLVIQKITKQLNDNQDNCIRLFPAGEATNFDKNYFLDNYSNELFPDGSTQVTANIMNSFNLEFELPAGKYVILPTSVNAGVEMTLCVRVLSQGKAAAQPIIRN